MDAYSVPPKSSTQRALEAEAEAANTSSLVPVSDRIAHRKHSPSPFGIRSDADPTLQYDAERRILSLLPVVGKGRAGMPPTAEALSDEERGSERTELHHFSQFPRAQVDAAMQLRALAALCNASDPFRGSLGSGWMLADRRWLEELPAEVLSQRMLDASATSAPPLSLSTYHARDDVMLIAQHRAVPDERVQASTYRCPLYHLVSRKFGAWHSWLMRQSVSDDEKSQC